LNQSIISCLIVQHLCFCFRSSFKLPVEILLWTPIAITLDPVKLAGRPKSKRELLRSEHEIAFETFDRERYPALARLPPSRQRRSRINAQSNQQSHCCHPCLTLVQSSRSGSDKNCEFGRDWYAVPCFDAEFLTLMNYLLT
jgi:hypothetical protein